MAEKPQPTASTSRPQTRTTTAASTISPPRHGRRIVVEKKSDLLFTPSSALPEIHLAPHTPILLGSATLPGYYGSTHSYDDQGAYYGDSSLVSYRFRLPYACGVLGYYC